AREYTREAGVRRLERRIGDLCRKAAVQVARGSEEPIDVTEELTRKWLGPRRFSAETRRRTADPGVATGLAYTPVGGDVLYIEAQAYPGRGKLTLTGRVLPIGGVRDKVLAAQRAGLGRVILPRENEHDLEELPPETRDEVRFVLVDSIDEVFDAAFSSNGAGTNGRVRAATA